MERPTDDICDAPVIMSDNMNVNATVDLPEGPGLGATISDEKIEQYWVLDIPLALRKAVQATNRHCPPLAKRS